MLLPHGMQLSQYSVKFMFQSGNAFIQRARTIDVLWRTCHWASRRTQARATGPKTAAAETAAATKASRAAKASTTAILWSWRVWAAIAGPRLGAARLRAVPISRSFRRSAWRTGPSWRTIVIRLSGKRF